MRYALSLAAVFAISFCVTGNLLAQLPEPGPEFEILKSEVGTWDVEIKAWTGPGDPDVTKGVERNRMLGGFWLISDFKGTMMGLDFQGHGTYSYDEKKKTYIGRWMDSLSPQAMDMTGKYDKEAKTMTYTGMAPGMDGTPTKNVLKTKYNDDGSKVMTMHMQAGDEMTKVFEMKFTKAKAGTAK